MTITFTEWEEVMPAWLREDYLLLLAALAERQRVAAEEPKDAGG